MDSINRLNSPMALYVEDLTEQPLELERRKKTAQKSVQESPASFLVGSMESVSQKIAHLEQQLNNFCSDDLAIESPEMQRTKSIEEHLTKCYNPKKKKTQCEKKSKEYEKNELQKFTHRYQLSMIKTDFAKYPKSVEMSKKEIKLKPKLAELYQFPGFSNHGPLPLPHEVSMSTIIEKVVSAHKNTGAKICPTRELYRTLSTPVAQKILLDCFWWIFLQSYKPDAESQSKLFDRVAENYIHLLTLSQGSYHGDAFLNVFPSVLSQAIYSSFCFSFPQSLHQFQSDDFKDHLCSLLWQWFGGICPVSGVYNTWDRSTLEPKDDTSNGKVQEKKDSDSFWFGLSNAEEHNKFSTTLGFRPRKYSVFKPSRKNSSAAVQPSLHKKEVAVSLPIKHSQSLAGSEARDVAKLKPTEESRSVCQKSNFIHMVFNLSGHSPLVQYYLEKQKADSQSGMNVLVHRTEIQK
ncbi:protein FAM227A isoform X2 [Hyla sarda]|nr:protein FAM227A isoform X2 [Hyla sarda]